MSKFLINLFIRFGKSESLRKAALNLLKDLAQQTQTMTLMMQSSR